MVKILWVDDEIELLKPHVLFLRGKGYEVDTCNNGYDAIDMATEGNYDLIILDEMMPGMTGLETLPKIKEIRPTTPVIMVTKSEEENIMDKAVGSKIADYLIKPVNPNQVLLSIKKNVHSQQLVTEQTTADYRAEFGRLSSALQMADSFADWCNVYRRIRVVLPAPISPRKTTTERPSSAFMTAAAACGNSSRESMWMVCMIYCLGFSTM